MEGRKRLGMLDFIKDDKSGLNQVSNSFNNFMKKRGLISNKKEGRLFKPIKGKLKVIDERLNDIYLKLDFMHEKINKRLDLIENKIISKLENDNFYTTDHLNEIEEKLIYLKKELTDDSEDDDDDDDLV